MPLSTNVDNISKCNRADPIILQRTTEKHPRKQVKRSSLLLLKTVQLGLTNHQPMPIHIRINYPTMLRPNIRQQDDRKMRLSLKLEATVFHIRRKAPEDLLFLRSVGFALIDAVAHGADYGVEFAEEDHIFLAVEGVPGLQGEESVGVLLVVVSHCFVDIAHAPEVLLRVTTV